MLTRRITYRIYPSATQAAKLYLWKRMHCNLYNAALANRITQYKKFGKSVNYFKQQNSLPAFKTVWPEYVELGSQALQATLKRVDFAFERFFKGLGGCPRFKASRRYSGFTYPASVGWKCVTDAGLNGHLTISNLGKIQMRGQARTWGDPTTLTVFVRAGKWFASITVKCNPTRATGEGAVGGVRDRTPIDLGCKEAVTLSTGEQISKPDFIKAGELKVKVASRQLRRKRVPNRNKKIKASRKGKKARAIVSRHQRKVTRQRDNWLHQTTSNIVSSNSLVAGEQLNVKGMTARAKKGKRKKQKAGLNRSILSVGFAKISKMFEYKLAEGGGFYVESSTRQLKPSQRCAKCWELTPKTLKDRVHVCSNSKCGHVEDRDINAAQVNLIWAQGLGTSLLDGDGSSSTACGSMKQLAQMKRQKSQAVEGLGDLETPSLYRVG